MSGIGVDCQNLLLTSDCESESLIVPQAGVVSQATLFHLREKELEGVACETKAGVG